MKVLYLSYDGLTDPLGQSQILPYLAGLRRGEAYEITIISFEKKLRFLSTRNSIDDFCKRHQLNWIPLIYQKHPPVISTLYDVWRLYRKSIALHRKESFHLVHCRSYITALVGLRLKRQYGLRFIFDMRGFWADERVEGGLWNLENPLYRRIYNFFKKKEREYVKESDAVISLTENARQEIMTWKLNTTVHVIPCCVDLAAFDPSRLSADRKEVSREKLGIHHEDFVLLYLGSWGTWYEGEAMMNFFTQVKKFASTAHFLIVSQDHVDLTGHPFAADIHCLSAPWAKVPQLIALANASIVFIKPVFSKKASSATKLAEVLAMGLPVVTNTGWGDISYLRNTLPGLYTVSSPADYPAAIQLLLGPHDAAGIRNGAAGAFSLQEGIDRYREVYEGLA